MNVPIDLKQYGWSETFVNLLDDETVMGLFTSNKYRMQLLHSCLQSQKEYKSAEADKVIASYNIKNVENTYSKPNKFGSFMQGVGSAFANFFSGIFSGMLGPVVIIAVVILLFLFVF